jgi:glycine hydroxymethyltransferase
MNKKKTIGNAIDSKVFPGSQGGPLMHVIAAKAVAFGEALEPSFKIYSEQTIKNAQTLAKTLVDFGYKLVSNGTDNHLMLVDLSPRNITGKAAQQALEDSGITVNKNTVPNEKQSPFVTSGIRIGTPAITTRGMKEPEMKVIGSLINEVLTHLDDQTMSKKVREQVREVCKKFPLYEDI